MLLLVLLTAGLHEEGIRRHLAPWLVGIALPHDAAVAVEAACPPGERFSSSSGVNWFITIAILRLLFSRKQILTKLC